MSERIDLEKARKRNAAIKEMLRRPEEVLSVTHRFLAEESTDRVDALITELAAAQEIIKGDAVKVLLGRDMMIALLKRQRDALKGALRRMWERCCGDERGMDDSHLEAIAQAHDLRIEVERLRNLAVALEQRVAAGVPELTLRRLQEEQRPWVRHNFGDREAWQPLLGASEELGEAAHAFLKAHQGIRGSRDRHMAKLQDAIGDTVIFLSDLCTAMGFDFQEILERTWAEVKQRDWKENPDGVGYGDPQ